jgi:hypothetical protein
VGRYICEETRVQSSSFFVTSILFQSLILCCTELSSLSVPVNSRFFRILNGFRNITDSGNVCTVSEICIRFPKYVYVFRNILDVFRCSSTPRVQYHSIRGTTRSLDFDGIGGSTRGGNEGNEGWLCVHCAKTQNQKCRSESESNQNPAILGLGRLETALRCALQFFYSAF